MSKQSIGNLSATLTADVSGMVSGLRQAESAYRRLQAAQAEAITGGGTRVNASALSDMLAEQQRVQQMTGYQQAGAYDRSAFSSALAEEAMQREQALIDEMASAREESVRRIAAREAALHQQNQNAIEAESNARRAAYDEQIREEARLRDVAEARIRLRQAEVDSMQALQRFTGYQQAGAYDRSAFSSALAEEAMQREQALIDEMASAREESVRRAAAREAALHQQNQNAIEAESNARRAAIDEQIRKEAQMRDVLETRIRLRQAEVDSMQALQRFTGYQQAGAYDASRLQAFTGATQRATIETKKLWAAQIQARVAANALAYSVGATGGAMGGAAMAARRMGNTADDSLKSYSRFGLAMQQTGYQVQDFAVQVTSGTNAMVAFSQQATQLLGFFGGWKGAIAGAALAAGILVYRLWDMKAGADAAKKSMEAAAAAAKAYLDAYRALEEFRNPGTASIFATQDLGQARANLYEARAGLAEAEKARDQALATIDDLQNPAPGRERGLLSAIFSQEVARGDLSEARKVAEEANAKILQRQAEIRAAELVVARLETEETRKQTEAYLAAARSQKEALQERIEAGNRVYLMEQERLKGLRTEADAILDTLDPMRKRIREQERLNELVAANVGLTREQADEYLRRRDIDALSRLSLPAAMQGNNSVSALGLTLGGTDPTGQAQLETQRQMLAALRNIYTAVGNN